MQNSAWLLELKVDAVWRDAVNAFSEKNPSKTPQLLILFFFIFDRNVFKMCYKLT